MKPATKQSKIKIVISKTAALKPRRKKQIPPITINPERLGGTPTIAATRLPIVTLIDYLNDPASISKFKADFPGVDDEQIQAVIETIRAALEDGWLGQKIDY